MRTDPLDAVTAEALLVALADEARAMDAVREALLSQRAAVAANETERVEASVQAIGRNLLLVEEAHRRRTAVVTALAGSDDPPALDRIEQLATPSQRQALADARATLRSAAAAVTREARINQQVLKGAVAAGDAFLQQLFTAAAAGPATYGRSPIIDEPRADAGLLLNRIA
ncbi:MAG: flagellar export chaperone FlgN [Gemmatimonadota bacterium]